MKKIKKYEKNSSHSNKKFKFFSNEILNQLNLEEIRKNSLIAFSNSKIDNKSGLLKACQIKLKNKNKINNSLGKGINEYKNNENKIQNNKKPRYLKNINSLNNINRKNNLKILYKKYLLGNDVVLPFKSIKQLENSNIPYYIFDNSNNKINSFSPIKKNLISRPHSLMKKNSYKIYNYLKSSNKIVKQNNFKKKLLFNNDESKNLLINSKNKKLNQDFNLYDSIDFQNNSKKSINNIIYFNTQQNYRNNKTKKIIQLKNNLSNYKLNNKITFFPIKRQKSANIRTINYLNNKKNNNNKGEINDKKKILSYEKIKNLFDEPNSFIYLIFNKMKNLNLEEMENLRKLDMKKRFNEYKKDLNKLEQSARYELFKLKKQIVQGKEAGIKGKIVSTNTFFNLAFGDY